MAQASNVTHELNYVTANRFYVEMESTLTASFTECSGLGVKVKKDNYFEGGVNKEQRVLLGQAEYTDVTLKRGITDSLTFWDWLQTVLTERPERRNINIIVFNQAGETMQCWTLIGAVPVGWKAPSLQADGSTLAVEELTLAYESLKITKQGGGKAIVVKRDSSGYFL